MTQKDFAKKICVSTSFLTLIELEQKNVLDRHIKLIVSTYGVNETWLRSGDGEMFENGIGSDHKIAETVEIFKQLSPFFQDFILEQLYKLLEYEKILIPGNINYNNISNLALEAKDKLNKIRPTSIGQAMRISGVNPADISILMIAIKRGNYE